MSSRRLLQTPAGFLVDRVGARVVLIAGVALGAAAFAVAGLVHSFAVFVAMFARRRPRQHGLSPGRLFAVVASQRRRRGSASIFVFHTFAGILGAAVAPATLLAMQSHFGWRGAFVGAAILGFAVLALLIAQRPASPIALGGQAPPRRRRSEDRPADAASWRLLLSPPIMLNLGFFILISLMGGLNTFLVVALGALYGTLRHARQRGADRRCCR